MNTVIITGDNSLAIETQNKIVEIERKIAELKAIQDSLKAELMSEMEKREIVSIKTDKLLINYIQPTTKESFDSKRLKEENLDLYNKYCKISPVKGYVKVKVLDD